MRTKHRIKRTAVVTAAVGLAGLTALAAGPTPGLTAVQGPPANGVERPGTVRQPRLVPLAPHVLEGMRQQGKSFKDPLQQKAFGNNNGKKFNPGGQALEALPVAPVQKVLVIFVDFATPPPGGPEQRLDLKYFDDLLFGTVYDPPEYAAYPGHPIDRTLKNYFNEVSYGKVDIVTANLPSALGWVKLGKPYDYYCRADGLHDNGLGWQFPENAAGMVVEALMAVDSVVDFRQYAVNGEVPNLFVVHAGTGAEWSSDPSILWSHQAFLSWIPLSLNLDGVKINRYVVVPEVGGDLTGYWVQPSGPFPPTVSVVAHEWTHVLGVPDQYDYGYESDGTGMYSLMSFGGWGWSCPDITYPDYLMFLGNSPTHLDAWSKCRLGFVTPIRVEPGTSVPAVLPPVELEPVVYRMDVPNSSGVEYFLLENRQHIGFDEGLRFSATSFDPQRLRVGGHGLAIWHIDEVILSGGPYVWSTFRPNEAENWKEYRSVGWQKAWTGETHYGISIIQADDQWHLEQASWAGGDPADLYPGTLGVTRFGDDTFPNSSSYYFWPGAEPKYGLSGVTVNNIREVEGVVTADLSFTR